MNIGYLDPLRSILTLLGAYAPESKLLLGAKDTLDSSKFEQGCGMSYALVPSFFASGLEDGSVPTFWPLLLFFDDDMYQTPPGLK